jgi:hypothetical protein
MGMSKVCAIDLPETFDLETYDRTSGRVARLTERESVGKSVYQAFGSAWLGVGYRIAAAVHYDEEFREALAKGGPGPSGAERLTQERALFGCATSAVSSIDCFFIWRRTR